MRPIVLAHGIAPFDEPLARLGVNVYFRFASDLGERFEVHETRVDFAGSVTRRARELKRQIDDILAKGADKVHIIAHSMGGLDARRMIVEQDMAGRVASLTTIGTPHLGTPFADLGVGVADAIVRDAVARVSLLGLDVNGLNDLTTQACSEFNRRAEASEAANPVRYRTIASHQHRSRVFTLLKPSWDVIQSRSGENDGLVPVSSQRWTGVLHGADGTVKPVEQGQLGFEADHLNQIGWWDLAELRWFRWFARWRARRAFERRIRDLYLGIANEVTAGDPE